jgi:cobalt-zinc-cadmium efflux system membrane fusion protein
MHHRTKIAALTLLAPALITACGREAPRKAAATDAAADTLAAADGHERDPNRLYCNEHDLYEDECFYCHPEILKSAPGDSTPGRALPPAPSGLFCNEHGVPERECGICQPALADALEPGEGLKIRLLSPDAAEKAGIRSVSVDNRTSAETVTVPGVLGFDQNRVARITPQVEGIVRAVHVDLGEDVSAGSALVTLSSPEIAQAKAALLGARSEERVASQQLERESSLEAQGVTSERELIDARARHTAAVTTRRVAGQRLLDLGFSEKDVARIEASETADSRLVLRAPFGGTVIERQAVVGDVVAPGNRLLSLCDLDTLWLDLSVPEAPAMRLTPGTAVQIHPSNLDRTFTGEVTWTSPELDPATRLARVRARLPNPGRLLKAGMYVDADIALGTREGAVSVGRDAVHRFGGRPFVFLELEPDLYEVRRVDVGGERDGELLVTAGLTPRDRLVVDRSYLIKSEFQKSRLGAGCVD